MPLPALIERKRDLPTSTFFLFGPRGTGKTWWLRHELPNARWVNLLDPAQFQTMDAEPDRLRDVLDAAPAGAPIVIDEIQRLPVLLDMVHLLISEGVERQFILTGSSARSLRRKGVNLLGGRALDLKMHPFMACELGSAFDLSAALSFGMVPTVVASDDPGPQLRSYAATYIQEEVQAERLTRSTADFSRFLQAISFSQGSVLTVSNVAEDCMVSRSTVENYINILHDLLLAFTVPVFTRKAKRKMSTHPKFYFFDAGVYRAFRPTGPLNRPEEIDGLALESLVVQHLRAWCDYTREPHSLSFWRTAEKVEVDAVLYGPQGLFAFEIKNTDKVRDADLRGLVAFGKDYPIAKRYFLYRGRDRIMRKGVLCMPVEEFLLNLTPGTIPS